MRQNTSSFTFSKFDSFNSKALVSCLDLWYHNSFIPIHVWLVAIRRKHYCIAGIV